MTQRQIDAICDFALTLVVSAVLAGLLFWAGMPWWAIAAAVHFETATWFIGRMRRKANE